MIKENDVFYLSDNSGMAHCAGQDSCHSGLFSRDTRFLSRMEWFMAPDVLVLLESETLSAYDSYYRYTNQPPSAASSIPRESLLVTRHQWIGDNSLHETVSIENFSMETVSLQAGYVVDADFIDMFEVRGFEHRPFTRRVAVEGDGNICVYRYKAEDGRITETQVSMHTGDPLSEGGPVESAWESVAAGTTARRWSQPLVIGPHDKVEIFLSAQLTWRDEPASHLGSIDAAPGQNGGSSDFGGFRRIHASHQKWFDDMPKVSGSQQFSDWYGQGLRDLRMLQSDLGYGNMVVAGVPWYAVPFGRDSLIAARQLLLAAPEVARGTLLTMAHFQGQEERPERDEQPGKIVHEVRDGELSRLGILPFAPYYGSIDATPLFLLLLADYYRWTGDTDFVRELLPHVDRALIWMMVYGDRDGDGFLEYWQEAREGIANQGWKDSGDSIMYEDGRLVEGPVALCEVQAYAHRAYTEWSRIYASLGVPDYAQMLFLRAERLQERFTRQFVQPDGTVALALDGGKRPCKVVASNMGQVLVSDLLTGREADVAAAHMVSPHMLTGYGIRTLSNQEIRYNPLSYHNGSVWPHDTSLIAYGLRRHGYLPEALTVIDNLLHAQDAFDHHRLPELFAGFSEQESAHPVPYPVSCSPQAWAAAVPVFVLEQLIGLRPDALNRRISVDPVLPAAMPYLEVGGIRLGRGFLSISLRAHGSQAVAMEVIENSTGWELVQEPIVKGVLPR